MGVVKLDGVVVGTTRFKLGRRGKELIVEQACELGAS